MTAAWAEQLPDRTASTTLTITVPVGREDPLVAEIADAAMDAADRRGFDAIVSGETVIGESHRQ